MTTKTPKLPSWAPYECNFCTDPEMAWAYPFGEVRFERRLPNGETHVIDHDAQVWFACRRCKSHIDRDDWAGLAVALGKPDDHFKRLRAAKLNTSGYSWKRRNTRPRY